MPNLVSIAAAASDLTNVPIQISPTNSMKKLNVAALPQWNIHARRLLADDPLTLHTRDFESTLHEYDNLTYGALLYI